MSVTYFYNFSARTYPDYSETAFDTMIVSDGYIINCGFGITKPFAKTPAVDLEGAIILPPFVDSHTHFLQTGIVNSGCQLDKAENVKDVVDIVENECKKNRIVLGWNLGKFSMREIRELVSEIEKLGNKNFIWLVSQDLHHCIANNEAIKWAKKNYSLYDYSENYVGGEAYNFLSYKINDLLSEDYKLSSLKKVEKHCISKGVATVHALEGTENNPYETMLVNKFFKNSKLESIIYNQSSNPSIPLKNNWKQMGGCILVDGSIASRTAAMFDEYYDEKTKGDLYLNSDAVMDITKTAKKNNLQLALHAIGDVACEIVASSYMWAEESFGASELPNRIEHFILPNNKSIRNARKSNAVIGIQPAYDYYWGGKDGLYAHRLGVERALNCNPYKTLADSGIILIGGSDSPVTPIDPMLGIHSLVNHTNSDEQLSLNQAFCIFINEPHRAVGNFEKRGHLRIGERADFICLDTDPFKTFRRRIKDIKVTAMYLKGEIVS